MMRPPPGSSFFFFFFNDTATTEIYTLSLQRRSSDLLAVGVVAEDRRDVEVVGDDAQALVMEQLARHRSEEHTSELQSQSNLVCRLLLEKKKTHDPTPHPPQRAEGDARRDRRRARQCA